MPNSKRRFPFFWKTNEVYEENSAPQDPTYEFNTNLETAYIRMLQSSGRMPYTIQEIRSFIRNPMANIEAIRNLAHWAYYSNGVVASGIDYMRTMHTLDGVIVSRSKRADGKRPRNYRMNKQKMEATLHTIRYKQVIRDAI